MKAILKRILSGALSPLGLELQRRREAPEGGHGNFRHSMPACVDRLTHAMEIGFAPELIIDGGAFVGEWTSEVSRVFPNASILAIEANPHVFKDLETRVSPLGSRVKVISAALAESDGTTRLNIWGDPAEATSASLHAHVQGKADQEVEVQAVTLDGLLTGMSNTPDLVKLDLQGGELRALKGAEKALRDAEMFIVEFGCLPAYVERATPHDLMEIFYDHQFVLYDIVDCHYRPYDGALTGGDFFFAKRNSPLKAYAGWE